MTQLNKRVLASYSSAAVPLAAMGLPIAVYIPPFYAESMGLSLASIGLIFTLARIWDVITDPIMGAIIDRYETRWGRRKHWIAIGVPILMLSVYMVFLPSPEGVSVTYLAFWMLVLYVGYTMMTIAHQSWGAELSATYDDRSRLYSWREIFVVGGMTLALAIPAVVEQVGSGLQADKVAGMGIYVLLLFPLTVLPTLLFVPDKRSTTNVAVDWATAIRIIASNRLLWRLLASVLFSNFASTASGTMYIFFASYIFELPSLASLSLLFYFLTGTLAMPLWMKLAIAVGKERAIKVALTYGIVAKLAIFFVADPGNIAMFWTYTLLTGVAFGATPTLLRSMMADLTDVDELEGGQKRAGLFFALLNTIDKLGSAIAVGLVLYILEQVVGFQPGTGNSPEVIQDTLAVYCFTPVIAYVLTFIPLLRYPLNKLAHDKVRIQLAARAQ